jgi:hypothetical protein
MSEAVTAVSPGQEEGPAIMQRTARNSRQGER